MTDDVIRLAAPGYRVASKVLLQTSRRRPAACGRSTRRRLVDGLALTPSGSAGGVRKIRRPSTFQRQTTSDPADSEERS